MPFDMWTRIIVLNWDDVFQCVLFNLEDIIPHTIYTRCIKYLYINLNLQDLTYSGTDLALTVREWVRLGFRQTQSCLYMWATELSSRALDTLHDSFDWQAPILCGWPCVASEVQICRHSFESNAAIDHCWSRFRLWKIPGLELDSKRPWCVAWPFERIPSVCWR